MPLRKATERRRRQRAPPMPRVDVEATEDFELLLRSQLQGHLRRQLARLGHADRMV